VQRVDKASSASPWPGWYRPVDQEQRDHNGQNTFSQAFHQDAPKAAALDKGYSALQNIQQFEARGIDPFIATGREPHHQCQ
jgi:hypothetical protein